MNIRKILLYLFLIFLIITVSLPFLLIINLSFKSLQEVQTDRWGIPSQLNIQNYVEAVKIISPKLFNSFIVAIPAVIGSVFFASLAAFGLSQFTFRLKSVYFYIIIATALIPVHVIIAPIFSLWNSMNLVNTYQGLILIYIIVSTPFAVIIIRGFFENIPKELIEAAQIEGCSLIKIFWKIILPISKPALISAALIEFTFIWNDFLWPLILAPREQYHTATMGLLQLTGQFSTDWHLMAASALIASIPPLILFVAFQQYFIKGLMGGAIIKG
jgi:multiple sugar transport system permease protein